MATFKKVVIFQREQFEEGVAARKQQAEELNAAVESAVAKRVADISLAEERIPQLVPIAPLEELIKKEVDVDMYEPVFLRLKKLKKDFQVFSNTMRPRLRALEEAEKQRSADEKQERAAREDPCNWKHPGIWCHAMLVSCENAEQNLNHLFDYSCVPTWSCCQNAEKGSRGCRRSDHPDVDLLRIQDGRRFDLQ